MIEELTMSYNTIITLLPETPKPDPIIGLATEFKNDPNPNKVNAGIGVIVNEKGVIWIPSTVQKVASKMNPIPVGGYVVPTGELDWGGKIEYIEGLIRLFFPKMAQKLLSEKKVAAISTAGGTQAFSLFAVLMKHTNLGDHKTPGVLLSKPGYSNHDFTFAFNGIEIFYYNPLDSKMNFTKDDLEKQINLLPSGTVYVLHGNAHNPTGLNFNSQKEWTWLANIMKKNKLRAFFDLPYIGLGENLETDILPLEIFLEAGVPMAIGASFSKIGGLYNHRVGALIILTNSPQQSLDYSRYLNTLIRSSVSTPPGFGQELIGTILNSHQLRKEWIEDLDQMRKTIKDRRIKFAQIVGNNTIAKGLGLYGLMPFAPEVVEKLKKNSVYVLPTGRINFGGVSSNKINYFGQKVLELA